MPSRFVCFIEIVYEFVDNQVGEIYHGNRSFLVALALSLFTWIIAMNTMDLLPLDLPANVAGLSAPSMPTGASCPPPTSTAPSRWPSSCWCW